MKIIKEGDVFLDLRTKEKLIATTLSDSPSLIGGRRYLIHFSTKKPAGTEKDINLLNEDLYQSFP